MKNKIFTLVLVLFSIVGIVSKANSAILKAVAPGNWSTVATWDSICPDNSLAAATHVPTSNDSVVVPTGMTVSIDLSTSTCHGIIVQNGGILTMSSTGQLYTCYVTVNTGGVFNSATLSTSARALYLGFLGTTSQSGDFFIQNDGQFGGTAYLTADGISIFYSDKATSLTIQGTASGTSGTAYLGRILPKGDDVSVTNNLDLNIKQNISLGQSSAGMALSLVNGKKFGVTTTRTCTIYPGYTVAFANSGKFHSNSNYTGTTLGNIVYNIYGTLDLTPTTTSTGSFELFTSSFAGSTHSITINLGNGINRATLRLGRSIKLMKYFAGQSINFNFNNPNSRVVLSGTGAYTFWSQSAYKVPDYRVFPSTIRNISYENSTGGFNTPIPMTVTDTLSLLGNGGKLYIGKTFTANTDTISVGKLFFSSTNQAYLVSTATSVLSPAALPTWAAGESVTDANGNVYQCITSGMTCGTLEAVGSTTFTEITGAQVSVTGNVESSIYSTTDANSIFRVNAPLAVAGTIINATPGVFYVGKTTSTKDILNYGTINLNANTFSISGSVLAQGPGTIAAQKATIVCDGLSAQTLIGLTNDSVKNLTISGSNNNVALGIPLVVSGTLKLTTGTLSIGDYNLSAGSVSGGSTSSFIVTNGSGMLTQNVTAAASKTFPIGSSTTSYDPAIVKPTTTSNFSAKVSSVLSGSNSGGFGFNQSEWTITPATASSTLVELTPSSLVFSKTNPVIAQYKGSSYSTSTATVANGTFSGTFTSFEPFVTGSAITDGIINLNNNTVSVYSNGNKLIVSGTQVNDLITVISLNGQVVSKLKATENQISINLKSGAYIVRVNNGTTKVII